MSKQEKIEELKFIRDWTIEILNFMLDTEISYDKEMMCTFLNDFKRQIENAYTKQDMQDLKYAFHDLNEMAYGMRRDDINNLNKILKNKFRFNLEGKNKKDLVKIKAIVDRGHIKTNGEYYLIKGRIDALNGVDGYEEEMNRLDRLMTDYELSKRNNAKY